MSRRFDVLLSHNSEIKDQARELGNLLKKRGLTVWLDEWELTPGQPWQMEIEAMVKSVRSSAVLVGSDGIGPWQDMEMRTCLTQFVMRQLPVIPVLLPGSDQAPPLPPFLAEMTWVDFRLGFDDRGLDRLVWGITGEPPQRG